MEQKTKLSKSLFIFVGWIVGSFYGTSLAAQDSVAVFYRPEKAIVLINEQGADSRLQRLMNAFEAGEDLVVAAEDESVLIKCGRDNDSASCTFTFLPSDNTRFTDRRVAARIPLSETGRQTKGNLDLYFESSREDRFQIVIIDQVLTATAAKK